MMKGGLSLVTTNIISRSYKFFSIARRALSSAIIVMMAIFGQLILLSGNQNLKEKFSLNVLLDIEAMFNIFIKIRKIVNL
jgi:hypothetical protein